VGGYVQNGDHKPGKPSPEVGQDLADVVATGAEHGEEGISVGALQGATRQASIGFHVSDLGLDGTATAEVLRFHSGEDLEQTILRCVHVSTQWKSPHATEFSLINTHAVDFAVEVCGFSRFEAQGFVWLRAKPCSSGSAP
jgi:hypothetical protein